jgi:hypothetical protein
MVLSGKEKIFFILLCLLSFTVFVLTSDGHRFTFDEDVTQQQSMWISTMTPHPMFVLGESRELFQFPEYFPNNDRPICKIGILCSQVPIGASLTQVPFLILNQNFNFITQNTVEFTTDDFNDAHYVYWRNSLDSDFTFLELFYGPVFMSLSVGVFFLVSRTYSFSTKTSTMLSLLFGFTTSIWAYSQTSLNIVPATFFILLGFYFFRKFLLTTSYYGLLFSGIVLGFGFLVRNDTVLFIIPMFGFLIFNWLKNSNKIRNALSIMLLFALPLTISYIIRHQLRVLVSSDSSLGYNATAQFAKNQPVLLNAFGMLFSPGVGLLIFCPILLTIFFSYYDFFKKNKPECILFISFILIWLFVHGTTDSWHGLNGWSERYLTMLIPFLLLPLGFSIEKRASKKFYSILIGLASLGVIFNLAYLLTDVSWFIWGIMGSGKGLYELGHITQHIWVHPLVLWTFDYSQLTHAIRYALIDLHPDIFLLKIWGLAFYSIFSIISISLMTLYLIYLNKNSVKSLNKLS